MKLTIEGGKNLAQALNKIAPCLQQTVVVPALTWAALPLRDRAAGLAPRSGRAPHLADHIGISRFTARFWGDRISPTEYAVMVGPTKAFFYGYFIEFGTVSQGARPFMRPAFDVTVGECLTRIGIGLWREVQAATRAAGGTK